MKGEFRTVSNFLSILRALLIIFFVFVMSSPTPSARIGGCVIIAIAALTDRLDGLLARKYHQETEWGKILDPLADKFGAAAVTVVLVRSGDIPLWFLLVLLGRDLLILAGGLVVRMPHRKSYLVGREALLEIVEPEGKRPAEAAPSQT